ncbi:MAG: hypothetical protein EOO39_00240 [Cytophagaceae bacterium]|nr:MAG: hypothetical protein EOO39_00240 [Cytophagaceae bacterium]
MTREEKKRKAFEDLIFKGFGQMDIYDKVRHQLLRIRETMSELQPLYRSMSAVTQYNFATAINIIATHTGTQLINQFRIINRSKDEVFKYSMDEGFVEPTVVNLNERVLGPGKDES